MITTTDYGTWTNAVDRFSPTLESSLSAGFSGSEGPDGFEVEAIASDYRDAINAALPDSVTLSGDQFYGPYYPEDQNFEGYATDQNGDLDIKAIVEGVNLNAIVEKYRIAE